LPKGVDDDPVFFSYEPAANLNSDENVIVIILDTLDVLLMRAVLERYPFISDYLDGFTLYENNTAEHFSTIPSTVSMITQHHVRDGMDGWEYREEAWVLPNFIDILRKNGYTSNLYLDQVSTFERFDLIRNRADNFVEADNLITNYQHVIPTNIRLSLGRMSPYFLKNTWLASITPSFGRTFFNLFTEDEPNNYIPIVGIESDIRFHRFIKQSEFSADNKQRVFIMMHFNSIHADGDINDPGSYGYHYNEEFDELWYGGDRWDVGRASFEKLYYYFNKLKEIGVYDNSTIIITGDHGRRGEIPETTALFIKPKSSTGVLVTDTTTELSHKYFPASILDFAGIPHSEFGISYFDIINGLVPVPPVRILYVLGGWTPGMARTHGSHGVWEVVGDANNVESWTFVPDD